MAQRPLSPDRTLESVPAVADVGVRVISIDADEVTVEVTGNPQSVLVGTTERLRSARWLDPPGQTRRAQVRVDPGTIRARAGGVTFDNLGTVGKPERVRARRLAGEWSQR